MSWNSTRNEAKTFVAKKLLLKPRSELTKEEEMVIDELVHNVWEAAATYDAVWDSD